MKINLPPTELDETSGRSTILYGESGVGKSTQLVTAAEYLVHKYNKPVRLISAEDASKTIFMPLVSAGLVKPIYITKIDEPVAALRKLSRGEWPVSGAQGKLEWQAWDRSACGVILEGLSSIAELIQEDNREHGRFLGEQEKTKVISGGETLALPGQFSYNFTQLEMIKLMRAFAMIPGIERVVWSAHEYKGKSDDGMPIQGPALVGTAKTNSVGKYCGMLLHLDFAKSGRGVERRLHLENHADPALPAITCKAKVTIPLEVRERFNTLVGANKEGYLVIDDKLTKSLADIFRAEDTVIEEMSHKYARIS